MDRTPKVLLDAADIVGESIVYDDRRNALLWVDICGKRIHRLALGSGGHEVWPTPDFPTSVGLRCDGGAILGLRKQIVLWNYDGRFEPFVDIEPDLPGNRLNEGCVAPDGSVLGRDDAGQPHRRWRAEGDHGEYRFTLARDPRCIRGRG